MAKKVINHLYKAIKQKECDECKTLFTPYKTTDKWCSLSCVVEGAKKKVWKAEKQKMIDKARTRTEWLKLLQICINEIIRRIDYGHSCISCGGYGKVQSGHYHSTQANPTLRFHLFNIWLQDYRCNVELSANIIGYNKGLIEVFGMELKEYVETGIVSECKELRLGISDIELATKKAKEILKELPKEQKYTIEQRIELRKIYQEKLGIYK